MTQKPLFENIYGKYQEEIKKKVIDTQEITLKMTPVMFIF